MTMAIHIEMTSELIFIMLFFNFIVSFSKQLSKIVFTNRTSIVNEITHK